MAETVPASQRVNIYQPIVNSEIGLPPLVMRVVVTPVETYVPGAPLPPPRNEEYVCLGALPVDVREQVIAAIRKLAPPPA